LGRLGGAMQFCHTHYSFRYGTIAPKELIERAIAAEYDALVIADINNTSAILNSIRLGQNKGLNVVPGIDFRNGVQQRFVAIAKNNTGFYELNELLTQHLHQKAEIPERAPKLPNCYIIYPFAGYSGFRLRGNEYVGVAPHEIFKAQFSKALKKQKLVAQYTATFRHKADFNAHRLLRAIDKNTLLSKLAKSEESRQDTVFIDQKRLEQLYRDVPYMLENTRKLVDACRVPFDIGSEPEPKNLKTYTGSVRNDMQLLRKLCQDGLAYRYPNADEKIATRIHKELEIIQDKGFVSYFLINWDIVNYARRKNYFYVGRGSGANSIVAYLLKITDVDPIDLDLYFERFINLYRKNPPDFDLDFSWKDRDDITDYIFRRFPNTALLATYNTFQYKAVVRELGKVFGLPKHEIDKLSEGKFNPKRLDNLAELVLKYSTLIQGFPSHLSIHAGGILIADKPITNYTATFMPPKGFPTTQFDMIVAEDVGLYKFDILSQRGLSKIQDSLGIIRKNHPEKEAFDIHDIARFKQDEEVKELLRNGLAMGCFYVESPAMRMLLKKLKVDNYLALVAASSIIRPGVAQSGMMREYIKRYRYPEERKKAHPVMLDIMPDTFGVMVYQEDVIKVAHYFAGLTLGEADVLRRGMSGKYRSREEFNKVKAKYFANCREKGYTDALAKEIWRQIESFAGYAFAKGHSASYAVESYQSLFLKAHYPLEFMVAVINNFGGFYRTEFYVHEARMWGATIHAPCVNEGDYHTTIKGKDIYLGFIHLNEFETRVGMRVVAERDKNGPFADFDDFLDRVPISVEQVSILIRINAFRFTGKNKRALLWEAHLKLGKSKGEERPAELFRMPRKEYVLPTLDSSAVEEAFDQLELLGFALCSPFALLKQAPKNNILATDFPKYLGKKIEVYGYLVTRKETKTIKGDRMNFGTFLDQKGEFIDTTHFPQVAKAYPFRGRAIYRLVGRVVEEFGFYSMEVDEMYKEDLLADPRYDEPHKQIANQSSMINFLK
jgi:error-prone DNA polymerase